MQEADARRSRRGKFINYRPKKVCLLRTEGGGLPHEVTNFTAREERE